MASRLFWLPELYSGPIGQQHKNSRFHNYGGGYKTEFLQNTLLFRQNQAEKAVELKFQASGKLTWVGAKEGDTVTAYQALAGLDRREVQKNLEKALRDYSSERNDFEQTWRVTYDGKTPNDAFNDTVKRILEKTNGILEKAVLMSNSNICRWSLQRW